MIKDLDDSSSKENSFKTNLSASKLMEFSEIELKLISFSGKNLYLKVIHLVTIALNLENNLFQEKILKQAFVALEEIERIENEQLDNCVRDCPYVLTTLFHKSIYESSPENPFAKYLFNPSLVPKQKFPRAPILLAKTSRSLTFQIPVFNPKVSVKLLLEDPSKQFLGNSSEQIKFKLNWLNKFIKFSGILLNQNHCRYHSNTIINLAILEFQFFYSQSINPPYNLRILQNLW